MNKVFWRISRDFKRCHLIFRDFYFSLFNVWFSYTYAGSPHAKKRAVKFKKSSVLIWITWFFNRFNRFSWWLYKVYKKSVDLTKFLVKNIKKLCCPNKYRIMVNFTDTFSECSSLTIDVLNVRNGVYMFSYVVNFVVTPLEVSGDSRFFL